MEHWVHISEASTIMQKPERTLRLHAAQGKIKTKKEGKFWLFEVSQYTKKNPQPTTTASAPSSSGTSSDNVTEADDITNEEIEEFLESDDTKLKRKKRKSFKLEDLGVFKDLKILTERILNKDKENPLGKLLKSALIQVAEGFYEYESNYKVDKFRAARNRLAEVMAECSMSQDPDVSMIQEHVNSSIMPGLSGLIRKHVKYRKDRQYGR